MSGPLRAVHVGPSPDGIGGIESVIRSYVRRTWRGIDMTAVSTWDKTSATAQSPLLTYLRAIRSINRTVSHDQRTILHVHLSHKGSFVREGLVVALYRRRVRVIATIHGSAFVQTSQSRYWGLLYAFVLRRVGVVATLNSEAARHAQRLARNQRVILTTNPPPPEPAFVGLTPGDSAEVAVFAGSIGRRKGVDTLLDAWKRVRIDRPTAELHLYGPLAGDVTISGEGVRIMGSVTEDEVCIALRKCRLAVLPSTAEAMPVFVIEAMQAGRPVVVTKVGAMPQQVSDGGDAVEVGEPEALAGALTKYLSNPELATMVGNRARAGYDSRHSAETVNAELLALYEER